MTDDSVFRLSIIRFAHYTVESHLLNLTESYDVKPHIQHIDISD